MSSSSLKTRVLGKLSGMPLFNETERECCAVAVNSFEDGDYQECSDMYSQVLQGRSSTNAFSSDVYRLKHNILISDFFQTNCIDVDILYQGLRKIFLQGNIQVDNLNFGNIEEPIMLYNLAVLYYHHKQYQNALSIVEKLSNNLSNIMNTFSKQVNLLYVDVLLRLQQYDKALFEIEHFESQIKEPLSCTSPEPDIELVRDSLTIQQTDFEVCERLQQMKTLCYLGINSPASIKKECKQLINISNINKKGILIAIHMKARHEFLRGNLKKTLKLLVNLKESGECNFWETGDDLDMILSNNIGCLYYTLGKPNMGCRYFENASKCCDKLEYKDKKRQPLHCRAYNKKYEIMYNLGVGMLLMNQPVTETYMLLAACTKPFSSNPRLLLRIAQCCVKIHLENQNQTWKSETDDQLRRLKVDTRWNSVEPLFRRKICQENIFPEIREDLPKPSLQYALECINLAHQLIQSDTVQNEGCLYVKPSQPITNSIEISKLHASVLCTGAYIACLLRNYGTVIHYCAMVLRMEDISQTSNFLANMYLSEALLKTSRIDESLKCLNISAFVTSGQSGELTEDTSTNVNQIVSSGLDEYSMKVSVVYNHSVILLRSGRFDSAFELLEAWITSTFPRVPPPEFIVLIVKISKKIGNISRAEAVLQKFGI